MPLNDEKQRGDLNLVPAFASLITASILMSVHTVRGLADNLANTSHSHFALEGSQKFTDYT